MVMYMRVSKLLVGVMVMITILFFSGGVGVDFFCAHCSGCCVFIGCCDTVGIFDGCGGLLVG